MTPEERAIRIIGSANLIEANKELREAIAQARAEALEEAARLVEEMAGSFDEYSPRSFAAAIRALKPGETG